MQIVFGKDIAEEMREKYVLLELETFGQNTAYCVLTSEELINDITDIDRLMRVHQTVIDAWNTQKYDTVKLGIENLYGRFNGAVDSFYDVLQDRIKGMTIA